MLPEAVAQPVGTLGVLARLAAPTRHSYDDLDLFALLGQLKAADKDEPVVADEALFGGWVREGCARLLSVHR